VKDRADRRDQAPGKDLPVPGAPKRTASGWRAIVRKTGTGTETQTISASQAYDCSEPVPFSVPRRWLSPRKARHTGTGRQAHWALIWHSVPDFTVYVKPKSGPGGEKYELRSRNDKTTTNSEIQRTKGVPAAPGKLHQEKLQTASQVTGSAPRVEHRPLASPFLRRFDVSANVSARSKLWSPSLCS
jgi:hypothetical protein